MMRATVTARALECANADLDVCAKPSRVRWQNLIREEKRREDTM